REWTPRCVTSGIWRPVSWEAWNQVRINDLQVIVKSITPTAADLTANLEVEASSPGTTTILLENLSDKLVAGKQQIALKQGINRVTFNFFVTHPKLWWPNGLGAQPLYSFRARILVNGRVTDDKSTRTGLRTLELRQQRDDAGRSFMFLVNGIPVFAKGGNWIPADSFPTRISKDKYRYLLESVRDTSMIMLRVWGGGIYESADFYELCDEMGILVWQDYMFACSMYPATQESLANVRPEEIDNVNAH